jgi:carbon starvation protein
LLFLAREEGALWPLFGTTNQLLAGLSLTLVTSWLYRTGRPWLYTGIPMVIVLTISGLAMTLELGRYLREQNYLLLTFGACILALELWVVGEAIATIREGRRERAVAMS